MRRSTDRILTMHAGSLPRPDDVRAMVLAKGEGEAVDEAKLLAVGKAYQDAAGFLDRHPTLEEPK